MAELLRIETPQFELTIWTNDLDKRSRIYQLTRNKRNNSEAEGLELRFDPALQVNDELSTSYKLKEPLFFENTQYQFEWVFFDNVHHAYVGHRNQTLNNGFSFASKRNHIPARLIGTINTGNHVGWLKLPIHYELDDKKYQYDISLEVLPTKMALHQDLPLMYQAIDAEFPLWRFNLLAKTEQEVGKGKQRGDFPLMWLASFAKLRQQLEKGLKIISLAPHRRLQPNTNYIKSHKLKGRLSSKLETQLAQDRANGLWHKSYRLDKKILSVDTPENRFIKMVVKNTKKQLAEFENKLRNYNELEKQQRFSDTFIHELKAWQLPLNKILGQGFLNEVGDYKESGRESLVLQQKTGYSAVYRVWQELKFYLDLFSDQTHISMKSVAEIYEVWCFLTIKNILQHDLGFDLKISKKSPLTYNNIFEYELSDGFRGAFKFKRSDGVVVRLAHEPKFTPHGKGMRSYLVSQKPDIVLDINIPEKNGQPEKHFIWLFDAKYRIKTENDHFDVNNLDDIDYVPDDAINQMHRYRDALIRLSNKSDSLITDKNRPVFGAFALYPGFFDQIADTNPYANSIKEIGIGAFALLPNASEPEQGTAWLRNFLKQQIGNLASSSSYPFDKISEHLSVQDAARIPYGEMKQVLYPDLTMTAALGGAKGRDKEYFSRFEKGCAKWYHLPQATFIKAFKSYVAYEIRYLALASTSINNPSSKEITKIWPVKNVKLVQRCSMTIEQAGKNSQSKDLYYLFQLGQPLYLHDSVDNVPHRPIKNSMKLTTLSYLEEVKTFKDINKVYTDALVI